MHTLLHSGTLTGGLEALDVSGGLQEVATQVEEEEEEGEHGDEDPGDHRHRDGDHAKNLQEHLLRENKRKQNSSNLKSGCLLLTVVLLLAVNNAALGYVHLTCQLRNRRK